MYGSHQTHVEVSPNVRKSPNTCRGFPQCTEVCNLAMTAGRDEEGVALLQNAVAAARVSSDGGITLEQERGVLFTLIGALFKTNAIDEVEPHVPRYREMAKAESGRRGQLCLAELAGELLSARLHEVLPIRIPICNPRHAALPLHSTRSIGAV